MPEGQSLACTSLQRPGRWLLLGLLLASLNCASAADSQDSLLDSSQVRIAVNAELSQDNDPTRAQLRALYTLRLQQWRDGTPVRVFVLPDDHPAHQQFVKNVLKMYPYQLRELWDRGVYSGTGQAPREVDSLAEMEAQLASTPGALGYALERPVAVESVIQSPAADEADGIAEAAPDEPGQTTTELQTTDQATPDPQAPNPVLAELTDGDEPLSPPTKIRFIELP